MLVYLIRYLYGKIIAIMIIDGLVNKDPFMCLKKLKINTVPLHYIRSNLIFEKTNIDQSERTSVKSWLKYKTKV